MQVILKQNVPNLGKKGELKDVAPGYARNHLIPRGLALAATAQRLREWKNRMAKEELLEKQQEEQALAMAEKINKVELKFMMQAGEGGRLFGSVTSSDIASKLNNMGFDIDKKNVDIDDPIKSVGNHMASVKLYPGVKAQVSIKVEKVS